MRWFLYYLTPAMFLSCSSAVSGADDLLVSHQGVDISFREAFHYSLRHANPDAYERSMSQPLAVMRVLENIYLLKRIEEVEAGLALTTDEAKSFASADHKSRAALRRYLNFYTDQRMGEVDWEGLAKLEYASRLSDMQTEEQVRVEHVLVSIEDRDFEAFVQRIRAVNAAIENGDEFQDIALAFSDDPTVDVNRGDLGFFNRGRMQPNFSKAAFSMTEQGEIVGPVMTVFGAHFLRLVEKKGPEQIPYERVKRNIIDSIKSDTEAKIREELLDEYRAEIAPDLATLDYDALLERLLETRASELSGAP